MVRKVFFDTNIIIDILECRDGYQDSLAIIEHLRYAGVHLYISSLTLANAAYILRKKSKEDVMDNLGKVMRLFDVLPLNDSHITQAIKAVSADFEDMLQIMAAEDKSCDMIVTRDLKHFRPHTDMQVIDPREMLEALR